MKTSTILILAYLLIFTSCKHKSENCGKVCDSNEALLFQTGFTNTTITPINANWYSLSGIDTSLHYNNDWSKISDLDEIGNCKINCEDGTIDQRWAKIVADPQNASNSVLAFHISEPHIREGTWKKGRIQLDINENSCIKECYQTVRLYLHPDMEYLTQWDERFSWLSLFEFWNNANWTGEKYPFRVTVNITKPDKAAGNDLYFNAHSDIYRGVGRWKTIWEECNKNFKIPFGTWLTIDVYIKEGDNQSGRFYMAITPEGSTKQVLFDIVNYTQHPREKCPDGFSDIHPLKFYTSDDVINYMKNGGKNLEIYWDDWKLFKNKRPVD